MQRDAHPEAKREEVEPKRVKRDRDSEETLVDDEDAVSFIRSKRVKRPVALNEDDIEVVDLT